MTKEAWFDSGEEVVQASMVSGCLLFFIGGGIGLGLGWIFLGFLQGLGLGLVAAIATPLVCVPVLYYVFSKGKKNDI